MKLIVFFLSILTPSTLGHIIEHVEESIEITPHQSPSPFYSGIEEYFARNGTLGQFEHLAKRGTVKAHYDIQEKLVKFVGWLRSFAPGNYLNVSAFERSADWLDARLEEINRTLDSLPPSQELYIQFCFVNYMFQVMRDVAKCSRFYKLSFSELELVKNLARLNLRIIALHDAFGNPDPKVHAFREEIIMCNKYLKHWRFIYEDSVGIPKNVRVIVGNQLREAAVRLQVLSTIADDKTAGRSLSEIQE